MKNMDKSENTKINLKQNYDTMYKSLESIKSYTAKNLFLVYFQESKKINKLYIIF